MNRSTQLLPKNLLKQIRSTLSDNITCMGKVTFCYRDPLKYKGSSEEDNTEGGADAGVDEGTVETRDADKDDESSNDGETEGRDADKDDKGAGVGGDKGADDGNTEMVDVDNSEGAGNEEVMDT